MRYLTAFGLSALFLLAACKGGSEEDDAYPNMLTEFATIQTDSWGTMRTFTTDGGKTYTMTNPLTGYLEDYTYRAVCGYVPDGDRAYLRQAVEAYVLCDSTSLAYQSDATGVVSMWRGGGYINMQLSPLTQGGRQYWGFCVDSLRSRTTHLTLHHRQNGDPLSYTQTVYASLPLESLSMVPEGDSIAVHVPTFKGDRVWLFKK